MINFRWILFKWRQLRLLFATMYRDRYIRQEIQIVSILLPDGFSNTITIFNHYFKYDFNYLLVEYVGEKIGLWMTIFISTRTGHVISSFHDISPHAPLS